MKAKSVNGNVIVKSALNILFIFILIDGKSQVIADAGENKVACVGQYGVDTIEIGGNPSAIGGSGNYTYIWETCDSITIENLTFYFTASDFLDDTTKANPKVIDAPSNLGLDKLYFKLTVTDDFDSISIDSMNLIFSFKIISLIEYSYYIYEGDSVLLNGNGLLSSSLPIESYLWTPGYGLADSTSAITVAKPLKTTYYYLSITDTAGCSTESFLFYNIYVSPISSIKDDLLLSDVKIYPNPINSKSVISFNNTEGKEYSLEIYDSKGEIITKSTSNNNLFSVGDIIIPGLYYFNIIFENKIKVSGKFIKN